MKTDLSTIAAMLDPFLSSLEAGREGAAHETFRENRETREDARGHRPRRQEVAGDVRQLQVADRGGRF
jgi:hypothetical protein